MHILDYTVITDTRRYNQIVSEWREKFGHEPDFNMMIGKIINFSEMIRVLYKYALKC